MDHSDESLAEAPRAGEAVTWHGAWFIAGALATVAWSRYAADPAGQWALAVAASPGAAGILLRWRRSPRIRSALLGLWALAVAIAIILSGGLAGPLAAWVLMPLAAATVLGGRQNLARGAVLVAIVAAVAGLAQAAGLVAPGDQARPWLALFALTVAGAGLAAALATAEARTAGEGGRLAAERRRVELFLAAQPLLVLRLAPDGRIVDHLGPLFEPLTPDALARGFPSLAEDHEALERTLRQGFDQGRSEIGFAPAAAPDRWLVAVMFRHEAGLIATLRDASLERVREATLEQAANDAEALNAGKSRFLANMSHELRTPLNAVVGFSDIMRSRMFGPLSEKYAEYAALIHESGGHLLDLINDVLDLSKIEAQRYELSREPFDAREAVSAALRLVRVQADLAGVRLRGALPPGPVRVDADRRALKQIVLNLLSNALKFTPGGGSVDVALRADGDDLFIVVSDTGVGIPPADLERLGNPYEQAGGRDHKAMGTGLGLSLVRAFSELHGGAMSISSRVGEGTTVSVRMPVVLPQRRPEAAPLRTAGAMGDNVIAFNPQR